MLYLISDVACKYPPSLRVTVLETNLPKLRVGELFLITYKGGSLGREGDHDVIVPDINVSKVSYGCLKMHQIHLTQFEFRKVTR